MKIGNPLRQFYKEAYKDAWHKKLTPTSQRPCLYKKKKYNILTGREISDLKINDIWVRIYEKL